jgi:hypothetical protein
MRERVIINTDGFKAYLEACERRNRLLIHLFSSSSKPCIKQTDPASGCWEAAGFRMVWKGVNGLRPFLLWGWMPWLRRELVGGTATLAKPAYRWRWFT